MREFPEIRHLVLPQNRGYAGGVNAGLAEAFKSCEWAVLLTNDSLLENLPLPPAAPAIVAPKVLRRKAELVDSLGGHFIPSRARLVHCKSGEEFDAGRTQRGVRRYIPGTAFLVHREVFEKSAGLDERLCIYWDDVEWSARIDDLGFPLLTDPGWRVLHKVGKTAHSKSLYSLFYFQRNRRIISWRYAGRGERILLSFLLLKEWLRLTARLVATRRYNDLAYLPRIVCEQLPDYPARGTQPARAPETTAQVT